MYLYTAQLYQGIIADTNGQTETNPLKKVLPPRASDKRNAFLINIY